MVHLIYFCNNPIENGSLYGSQLRIMDAKDMVQVMKKIVINLVVELGI